MASLTLARHPASPTPTPRSWEEETTAPPPLTVERMLADLREQGHDLTVGDVEHGQGNGLRLQVRPCDRGAACQEHPAWDRTRAPVEPSSGDGLRHALCPPRLASG